MRFWILLLPQSELYVFAVCMAHGSHVSVANYYTAKESKDGIRKKELILVVTITYRLYLK